MVNRTWVQIQILLISTINSAAQQAYQHNAVRGSTDHSDGGTSQERVDVDSDMDINEERDLHVSWGGRTKRSHRESKSAYYDPFPDWTDPPNVIKRGFLVEPRPPSTPPPTQDPVTPFAPVGGTPIEAPTTPPIDTPSAPMEPPPFVAPSAPIVAPRAPIVAPSAPQPPSTPPPSQDPVTPFAPSGGIPIEAPTTPPIDTPSAPMEPPPFVAPSAPIVAPSAPIVAPSAPSVAPSAVVAPSAPVVAPSAPVVAPIVAPNAAAPT